ncbi:hypothetical protein IAU60_000738 [Kwoniella sp. DSM 27419]
MQPTTTVGTSGPSTPTPLHRTVHPVPALRRPFGSASAPTPPGHGESAGARSNSYLRSFVGALAVAGSKTWVLDEGHAEGGGVGWLVLAFWAGRLMGEVRDALDKSRKGKSTTHAPGRSVSPLIRFEILGLAVQSVAFFLALDLLGPLRLSIVALASPLLASLPLSSVKALLPFSPILVAALYAIVEGAIQTPTGLAATLAFVASTFLVERSLNELSLARGRNADKEKSASGGTLKSSIISATSASAVIFALYLLKAVPIPLPVSQVSGQRFASFTTGLLVRYIPFPFTSRSAPSSVLRLRTVRDKVMFLCTLPVLQFFALHPLPSAVDAFILLPLALTTILVAVEPATSSKIDHTSAWSFPNKNLSTARPSWSFVSLLPARWRPHFQTILNTPTSKKIFYFLLLNLAYMFVQMVYGVFTNSLGLISDAIHMLFDCLGLAVGLWASVAATWKPDGRYTFGYSRVETLSGFANGLFLILISIFIIFEAVQRVLDPPEMETHQLLLVSGIGLAINLWGMYATGGHHHHGHSHGHDHGHGHGHSHGHSHAPVNDKKHDHRHDRVHGHSESNGGLQGSSTRPSKTLSKRRSSGFLRAKAQEQALGHDDGSNHDHTHGHTHTRDHHHDHSSSNGHGSHNHSHTHDHAHDNSSHACNHDDDHNHDHTHGHDHDHARDHAHDDHGHGHDHSHSHNMRGVFLHVLADTLGSVGVIVSTILIRYTGWTGFDPIASLFIAVLIMASVVPLVIDSGRVLCLDVGEHKEDEIRKALTELSTVDGVANYAAPRFWPRCEGELVGSIHIQLAPSKSAYDPSKISTPYLGKSRAGDVIYTNAEKVMSRVEKVLKKRIRGLTELVVQVEGSEERGFCGCMTGGG